MPGGQLIHALAEEAPLIGLYVPTEQDTQLNDVVDPVIELYVPNGHSVHTEVPLTYAKEPAEHCEQEDEPGALN